MANKAGAREEPTEYHDLRIVLARHGQAKPGLPGDELGGGLTTLGKRQAHRLGRRLADQEFAHIYSSDMHRAHDTALAVVEHHRETPFTVTDVLREIYGFLIKPERPGKADREAMAGRAEQIQRFARRIVREHSLDNQILIVAHGNLIRFLVSSLAGVAPRRAVLFETSNTSVNEVIIQNGRFLWMYKSNDVAHLLPRQVT